MISVGDPVYLLSAKDVMSKRLESLVNQNYELHPREDHAISFSADEKMLQEMIESFGCIDDNYAHYATTKAEGRGLREACLNQPAYFTIVTRFVRVHSVVISGGQFTSFDQPTSYRIHLFANILFGQIC